MLGKELGTISPNIYGLFTENLSCVIYDGIWVGKNSKVPNIDGIRTELIEQMRRIKPAVVRFPGGCFADSYDWRDGIGPPDKRPRRKPLGGPLTRNPPREETVQKRETGLPEASFDTQYSTPLALASFTT